MYYVFHSLLKRNYKGSILYLLFHFLVGFGILGLINIFDFEGEITTISKGKTNLLYFLYVPSALICIYGLLFHRYKDSWEGDSDLPPAMHPDNLISFWTAVLICQVYLFTVLYLYFSGFESFNEAVLSPMGFLNLGLFSIQSRIIVANYLDAKNWFSRLKEKQTREWLIVFDLIFIFLMIFVILLDLQKLSRIVLFFYGFRLMRILLLVPYFNQVWRSISRGMRLTANYVTSFLVILLVFSLNSRMLFSSEGANFKSLSNSIYSNFQIILGNGFEMAENSGYMQFYVFAVTLIIGIIFTSTITALITDSLLAKKYGTEPSDENIIPWYKRRSDEPLVFFTFRLSLFLSNL
jgi:hypothetical protein